MRELYGVIFAGTDFSVDTLKKHALLFDKFLIPNLTSFLGQCGPDEGATILKELQFLRDRETAYEIRRMVERSPVVILPDAPEEARSSLVTIGEDLETRITAVLLSGIQADIVPMCKDLPEHLSLPLPDLPALQGHQGNDQQHDTIRVALQSFPVPDETCAWQDILDFKVEMRDKQWGFRRFLHTLATKQQSESEIRDDIEWSLNDYTKEMDRFKLKRYVSFMETYVIPTVEALENFKPSSFLKGLVGIKKRKIELLEAESNAKGRECAYVFDARKRFGS
jgi:hypothetical protein